MLHTFTLPQLVSRRRCWPTRWTNCFVVAALGLGGGFIRPIVVAPLYACEPEANGKAPSPAASPADADRYVFAYVPDDFLALFALQPSAMVASPRMKPIADMLDETLRPGFSSEDLQQVTMVLPIPERDGRRLADLLGTEYRAFRTAGPTEFSALIAASYGRVDVERHSGRDIMTWGTSDQFIAFYAPNERTLISAPKHSLIESIADSQHAEPPVDAHEWRDEAIGPVFAVIDVKALHQTLSKEFSDDPFFQMLLPVLGTAKHVLVTLDDQSLSLRAKIICDSAEEVVAIEPTVRAALVLATNVVDALLSAPADAPLDDARRIWQLKRARQLKMVWQLLESVSIKAENEALAVTASIPDVASFVSAFRPQLRGVKRAVGRNQATNNLKELALAVYEYQAKVKQLPAAIVYGQSYGDLNPTGKNAKHVPRSWRVELLPHLGYEELYKQYRLDESWDSEANQAVLRQMPAVYRSPHDLPGSTNASYFALTGPTTVFDGKKGTSLAQIRDGTSNTILVVEAKRPTPWTKPEDIPYDAGKPLPKLGGWRPGEFLAALCDGSVLSVPVDVGGQTLKLWIGKADGVPSPPLEAPAAAPAPRR